MAIEVGSRVKVFDGSLFEDDITTPLSVTMQSATVKRLYWEKGEFGRKLADVEFEYRPGEISRGHFVDLIELIQT